MSRRRTIPPPTQVTLGDVYRLILGAIMIPLGATILWRAYSSGSLSVAAVLMGLAFIGYGAYRLYVGLTRYRMYRQGQARRGPLTMDDRR